MTLKKAWQAIWAVAVLIYALLLTALIPAFFFNYGSRLFNKMAELFPLHY